MKLYYAPGACSLADHIALHEAGVDFDLVKVDLRAKTTESGEDYTKLNPKGYVPALQLDDGEVLTENIAVLSYIADLSGKLMPSSGMEHWRVLEAAAFIGVVLVVGLVLPAINPQASEAEKDEARTVLAKRFALQGGWVEDDAFVVGREMSIADCYLFVMLMWAQKQKVDLPANLLAYFERIKQRPAVKLALQHEGLGG